MDHVEGRVLERLNVQLFSVINSHNFTSSVDLGGSKLVAFKLLLSPFLMILFLCCRSRKFKDSKLCGRLFWFWSNWKQLSFSLTFS